MSFPETALRFVCLILGLLVPGAAMLRALRLPPSLAGAFAGSTVVLFGTVIGFDLAGLPMGWPSLGLALVVVTIAAAIVARRRGGFEPARRRERLAGWLVPFAGMGRWTPLYLLFWAIVLFRAVTLPLGGPDTEFRWSWLAEQMLRQGSLDFYPPRDAADFEHYFWVESLPPGVAGLYAWVYACAGQFAPGWTVPVIVLQFWALHELLWRLAETIGGLRAARLACLAAAACPLLNWSFFIGQETGLTSIALVGLIWALVQYRAQPTRSTLVLAGLFAALGSATREYGIVFPLFGFFALAATRAPWRERGIFLLTGGALLAVWLIRTTLLTGNPFYSLDLAGMFPRNELFAIWREHDRGLNTANIAGLAGTLAALRLLVLFAPAALAGWLQVFSRPTPHRPLLIAGVIAFLGLWLISIPHTSGGLFYSLRVAAPAIALGALVAGVGLAALSSRFSTTIVVVLLLGTLPQTLSLPQNAWRTPWPEWSGRAAAQAARSAQGEEARAIAAAIGPGQTVVADNPGFQARLRPHGIEAVPPWCPQAAWLFDPKVSAEEVSRHWRETPMRYVLIARFPPTLEFIQQHARWSTPPLAYRIKWENDHWVLFELDLR
jgi:hypothetical protein